MILAGGLCVDAGRSAFSLRETDPNGMGVANGPRIRPSLRSGIRLSGCAAGGRRSVSRYERHIIVRSFASAGFLFATHGMNATDNHVTISTNNSSRFACCEADKLELRRSAELKDIPLIKLASRNDRMSSAAFGPPGRPRAASMLVFGGQLGLIRAICALAAIAGSQRESAGLADAASVGAAARGNCTRPRNGVKEADALAINRENIFMSRKLADRRVSRAAPRRTGSATKFQRAGSRAAGLVWL
jgi:hypothetical protein